MSFVQEEVEGLVKKRVVSQLTEALKAVNPHIAERVSHV